MTPRPALSLAWWTLRQTAGALLVLLGTSAALYAVVRLAPHAGPAGRVVAAAPAGTLPAEGLPGYTEWLAGVVRGDLGRSTAVQQGRPVADLVFAGLRRSLGLAAAGLALSSLISAGLTLIRSRWSDPGPASALSAAAHLVSAVPVFLLAYLTTLAGNRLVGAGIRAGWWDRPGWFPFPSRDDWVPWLVAALILAVGDGLLADLFRRTQAEWRAACAVEHRTGARLLGIPDWEVRVREALPGLAAHLSRRVSFVLGSTVVLEAALGWPGLGYLAWRAAAQRDLPLLLGAAVLMAAVVRAAGLLAELVRRWADPRTGGEAA